MVVGFKGEFETMEKLFIHSFMKHLSSTVIGSGGKKEMRCQVRPSWNFHSVGRKGEGR